MAESLKLLCSGIYQNVCGPDGDYLKLLKYLMHAAERVFADRVLLLTRTVNF